MRVSFIKSLGAGVYNEARLLDATYSIGCVANFSRRMPSTLLNYFLLTCEGWIKIKGILFNSFKLFPSSYNYYDFFYLLFNASHLYLRFDMC